MAKKGLFFYLDLVPLVLIHTQIVKGICLRLCSFKSVKKIMMKDYDCAKVGESGESLCMG